MQSPSQQPIALGGGRHAVPDNRWDLVAESTAAPTVSVVIPHYRQPRQLALVLEALTVQSYPDEQLEVIVADDGSPELPDVSAWTSRLTVGVVGQEDRGFRAAAARNLGAATSSGTVLCFLDADTVPTRDYVRRAVQIASTIPDAVVVGRRLHADMSDLHPESLEQWLSDAGAERSDGPEPQWLTEGYRRTRNLLEPGWDGYKYVLSAVMTCSREIFDAAGGFDASFERYGGEDWEFANRAFMMGAVLAHRRDAVAWHDGPDWGERAVADRSDEKNAEALTVAALVTDPAARTLGVHYRIPDHVVLLCVDGHSPASLMTSAASIVAGSDCAVWLVGDDTVRLGELLGVHDTRIRIGRPDSAILSRCRFVSEVQGRVVFSTDTLARLSEKVGPTLAGEVTVDFGGIDAVSVTTWTSRALHRARRRADESGMDEAALRAALFGARRVGSSDVGVAVASEEPRLAW